MGSPNICWITINDKPKYFTINSYSYISYFIVTKKNLNLHIWTLKDIQHWRIKLQHGLRKAKYLDKSGIYGNAYPKIFTSWVITEDAQLSILILLCIMLCQLFSISTAYIFSLPNNCICWNKISACSEHWLVTSLHSSDSLSYDFLASNLIANNVFILIILVKFLRRKILSRLPLIERQPVEWLCLSWLMTLLLIQWKDLRICIVHSLHHFKSI